MLDQSSIAERIASLPPGISPWSGHAVAIASIDLVKRDEVLAAIEHEPLDLVIADEAHHLSPGTDRGAAISRIASRVPWCVFVSATPHSGDRAEFEYLTSLGSTGEPITIFRRLRRDVGVTTSRRLHVLGVNPTEAEASLLAAIEAYSRAIWTRVDAGPRRSFDRDHDDAARRLSSPRSSALWPSPVLLSSRPRPTGIVAMGGESIDRMTSSRIDAVGAGLRRRRERTALEALSLASRCAAGSRFADCGAARYLVRAGPDLHGIPRHARRGHRLSRSSRRVGSSTAAFRRISGDRPSMR